MKFVNAVANKSLAEAELDQKARMRMNHNKVSEPPLNPPRVKPNRFAQKTRVVKEPKKILSSSLAPSSLRQQCKDGSSEPTNAEIMAYLLKNFPNTK